ncbi:MAG: YdcF family protein [Actinobacteria bacterium]|nr:YdcF family protein [Actinomycetota bacterium]MBV8959178.1 YdcF family protein [Actinomycetota bacterium]MBV9255916.1 YdcF family protein [Actinomycetota bacterium]
MIRGMTLLVALLLLYLGVTFAQVWLASRRDQARPVQAIVVLGAAQYAGRPSPVLKARLDHAADLYNRHLADVVVVTGGREAGDITTEAAASAQYLGTKGIPDSHILREVQGRTSWQSLAAAASFLKARNIKTVLLVSDPFHSARIAAMAKELGLTPYVSPTRTSPIHGSSAVPYFGKETIAVAAGRIVGFRRLVGIDKKLNQVKAKASGG